MRDSGLFQRICFFLTAMLALQAASAQKSHYVYLQSENNQPYYIEILGNTLSSNATGYLLIPQLSDGTYTMRVGFAKTLVEHGFGFSVAGADKGFSLKQGVDNNWSLFDLVDFTIIKGTVINIAKEGTAGQTEQEAAPKPTNTLKQVEAVKQDNVIKQPTVEALTSTQPEKPARALPVVRKIYDKTGVDGGVDQVYVIFNTEKNDTVILFVPVISREQTPKSGARALPVSHLVDSQDQWYAQQSVKTRPRRPVY